MLVAALCSNDMDLLIYLYMTVYVCTVFVYACRKALEAAEGRIFICMH